MDTFDDEQQQQPQVLFVGSGHTRPCATILKSNDRFAILLAADGREALDILRHHVVDVIVIDEDMPGMAAPYLLAATQELSPTTAAIILTKAAAEPAAHSRHSIRTLHVSRCEDALRAEIQDLLDNVVRGGAAGEGSEAREILADALLSQDLQDEARRHAAELYPDFARTMTEQELAATDVLEADGSEDSAPVIGLPRRHEEPTSPTSGVIVFSADPEVIRCLADAAQDRFQLLVASNIVQVVKLLRRHRPGVLVTDIAEDRNTIAAMTGRLKHHVPALVTVVVSAQTDPAEMAWLINHGHIFRFLRKPLSLGRCAVCLHAALQHHESLKAAPAIEVAADDDRVEDSGVISGVFARLKAAADRLA